MKNERARTSVDKAVPVVAVWKREVGALSTRNFAHRLAASEDLVLRLEVYKKLEKHRDGLVQHIDLRTGASTELLAIDKPTLPINIKQFKPKPSGWLYRLPTPQDLMFQLFSLQRRESSPELNRENSTSAESRELMQLILAFDARGDASSDEGGNGSGPEDLFC
ncbi:hypothetical protein V6N12_048286 [Hibiscus sabdariffa]|uniref:Uncharacterized protein n=1 Tax=Hibiscus sabdariffa TaxID=183260 RepID=A0ABR2EJ78_9ROSI